MRADHLSGAITASAGWFPASWEPTLAADPGHRVATAD